MYTRGMSEVKNVALKSLVEFQKQLRPNLILDVDGVLTDGKFSYTDQGKFSKTFGSHDSDALKIISERVNLFFISADKRGFAISESRINDMNFVLLHVDSVDRADFVASKKHEAQTAFIGDSFTDVPALRTANLSLVPQSAHPLAKAQADIILTANGGDGAVAEACIRIFPELFEWAMK
jgi:3-deoxy-D-manno-octulosonate 8-phosphate phosphatase (KDO 8-P phosphatase)